TFDMVVIDSSPVLAVSDAAALAQKAGHVLAVVAMATGRRRSVSQMSNVLATTRAKVLGLVLNRSAMDRESYAAYYGEGDPRPAPPRPPAGRPQPRPGQSERQPGESRPRPPATEPTA